ncbi:hypothetical protein Y036_638 [Burkholderia pseudomallei]|uniref:Uncharacterized protein n=1 Tax=Burkholderia pseudomallei TaxID=28450 RepID=A0AA40JDA6_BURPE|nr:hypothetical protein [Burkholderia pseudomallei]KGX08109.1 hypothetical protein Y036_638 [Burkholderia pseudomallei]
MNDQQQSRADALTKLVESYGHALIKQRSEEASAILEMIHGFAASSAEHPAAAPIIPTPADKRAAFEAWWTRDVPIEYRSMLPLLLQRNAKGEYDNPRCEGAWEIWQASAAASPAASEPLGWIAEGIDGYSKPTHYMNKDESMVRAYAGRLFGKMTVRPLSYADAPMVPGADAVAWVRKHPDTRALSGDWLWNDAIEQCRKDSGVWFPLGFLGARPALPEEPAAIHQVIHQVWVEETSSWTDVTPAYYAERQPSNRRRVYYAPQPAQADAPAEAREPIAWVTDDDRAITAAQKQRALADGGATASSVRPYSIPCYAVSAPADAGEAREPIGPHDLSTTAGGRSYVAEFFAKRLRRHDFGRYITGQLAADFACSLAAYLRDHDHAAADAGEAQPYAYVAPVSNYATRNKIVADRIGGLIPVYTAQPAARVASLTDAARDMLAERRRQVEAEGWTPKHDDEHDKGEMARAAACYALHAGSCFAWRADAYQSAKPHEGNPAAQNSLWPWDMQWWKPKDPRRDLVRAGALILAELERLDRATLLNGADKS